MAWKPNYRTTKQRSKTLSTSMRMPFSKLGSLQHQEQIKTLLSARTSMDRMRQRFESEQEHLWTSLMESLCLNLSQKQSKSDSDIVKEMNERLVIAGTKERMRSIIQQLSNEVADELFGRFVYGTHQPH